MRKAGIKKRLTEEFPEFIEQVILQRDALIQSKSAHIKTRDSLKMAIKDQQKDKKRRYDSTYFRILEYGFGKNKKFRAKATVAGVVNLMGYAKRSTRKQAENDLRSIKKALKYMAGLYVNI